MITTFAKQLDEPFALSTEAIEAYHRDGYVKLSAIFPPDLLEYYRREVSASVEKLAGDRLPLEQRTTYEKAFLQVMNLWRESTGASELMRSKRLARIAAELMGCDGVRLYHDQALYKEPGGGITPWHADQYYWPVSNNNTTTAWIPLQDTPLAMGPLAFCSGSHRFAGGRELAISDESEVRLKDALAEFPLDEAPFALGDVSFHSGWTFHRAGANTTALPREVFTVIYVDQDIRLAEPRNKNQQLDRERWCPGVDVGDILDSPLNPLLYSSRS